MIRGVRTRQHSYAPRLQRYRKVVARLATEVVSKEQTANRMKYTARHLHHVLHNFADGGLWDRHIHGADGDHEVQPGDDVPRILHELVQVGEVMLALRVRLVQIIR